MSTAIDRITVTLWITGEKLNPHDISCRLGIDPEFSIAPHLETREGERVEEWGVWEYMLEGLDYDTCLREFIRDIGARASVLSDLSKRYDVYILCRVFFDGGEWPVVSLQMTNEVMTQLAQLNIPFILRIHS